MNIDKFLKDSIFYPASGTDGRAGEVLYRYSNKSVNVDYTRSKEEVSYGLSNDFKPLGYNLISLEEIPESSLTPRSWVPHNIPLSPEEQNRISNLQNAQQAHPPFALLAKFKLSTDSTHSNEKVKEFSILHICGEACATYDALYLNRRISPIALAILNCGQGYGDNWTQFRNPKGRLKQLIDLNDHKPDWLLTNKNETPCWKEYQLVEEHPMLGATLFKLKK